MGFFRNLFTTAGETTQLTREVLLYKGLYEKECQKNDLLEKSIVAERKRTDKFVNTFCDQVSKQRGLPMMFKEKVEQPKQEPEPLSLADQESLRYIAEAMRQADIDSDIEPRPFEEYYNAVVANKHEYLNGR